ncbi:MAG: DUF4189 domain-containing protein [Burkholderiales bacterium]
MRAITIATAVLILVFALAADAAGAFRSRKQLWGAIAYNSKSGAYGFAVDRTSKRAAESEAFRQCGSDCDVTRTFSNSCGAIAGDAHHFAWGAGATRAIAEQKALGKCTSSACKIAVWACTSEK